VTSRHAQVGRVRVRGEASEGLSTALRRAWPTQTGVTGESVLVIRNMPDPLPGSLDAVGHSRRREHEWGKAMAADIESLAALASRPSMGPVPPGARAVVFRDGPELLSVLAADWLAGWVNPSWLWEVVLRSRGDPAVAVASVWADHPRAVPSALSALEDRGQAAKFVSALPSEGAQRVVSALVGTWGADPALVSTVQITEVLPESRTSADRHPGPWTGLVPSIDVRQMKPLSQLLYGVGLALARAPAAATSSAFWCELTEWLSDLAHPLPRRAPDTPRETVAQAPGNPSPRPAMADSSEHMSRRADQVEWSGAPLSSGAASPAWGAVPATAPGSQPLSRESADPGSVPVDRRWSERAPDSSAVEGSVAQRANSTVLLGRVQPKQLTSREGTDIPAVAAASAREGDHEALPGHSSETVERSAPAARAVCGTSEQVESRLGGIFFLLNAALEQGWYGDFTRPKDRGIPLDPWRMLSLLAAELLDADALGPDRLSGHQVADDPLWHLLENLAGDGPVGAEWQAWAREQAGRLRLELAEIFEVAEADAGNLLIRRQARVVAGPTHVNVHLLLDELQIELRLAGLDRDPGWVPATGRVIAFHFD
jgi:hypothetical protein